MGTGTAHGYDVIVVGGGAAGCVVAARFAADPARSVLLLEAGPDLRADPPELMHDGWRLYREHGWGFESQPDFRGLSEPLHRGRLLGGTSWVTRFAMRGSPADFDEWAALGNPGWAFDDVLPWFNLVETDLDFGDEPWHGRDGVLPITRHPEHAPTDYENALRAACAATGFDLVDDHNRPGAVGMSRMPRNARGGVRVTTADACLRLDDPHPNLELRADTPVAALVVDGTDVTGVRLLDGTVITSTRVVLCAGTYGSPVLLMRSGIGPADHLKGFDIPVAVDLPGVGSNLADHPTPSIDLGFRGEFRTAPIIHSMATFHSSGANSAGPPDLALWLSEPDGAPPAGYVDIVLLKPQARGSVRLSSADPCAAPLIALPEVRNGADVNRLCEGFERAWAVANDPRLRRLCADAPTPALPSAAELREFVRRETYSLPHTVGTCAMGPDPDGGAVVDPQGSVHGVAGLHVVDASIMPTAPSGFPHLITVMLAARLAEEMTRVE